MWLGKLVSSLYSVNNLPKSEAEKYMALLKELKPEAEIHIVEEDPNLCRLGFVREIPCTLQIELTYNEMNQLYEQILDMESEAYCNEDVLEKPYHQLDDRGKEIRQSILNSKKQYERYACLEAFLYHLKNE